MNRPAPGRPGHLAALARLGAPSHRLALRVRESSKQRRLVQQRLAHRLDRLRRLRPEHLAGLAHRLSLLRLANLLAQPDRLRRLALAQLNPRRPVPDFLAVPGYRAVRPGRLVPGCRLRLEYLTVPEALVAQLAREQSMLHRLARSHQLHRSALVDRLARQQSKQHRLAPESLAARLVQYCRSAQQAQPVQLNLAILVDLGRRLCRPRRLHQLHRLHRLTRLRLAVRCYRLNLAGLARRSRPYRLWSLGSLWRLAARLVPCYRCFRPVRVHRLVRQLLEALEAQVHRSVPQDQLLR